LRKLIYLFLILGALACSKVDDKRPVGEGPLPSAPSAVGNEVGNGGDVIATLPAEAWFLSEIDEREDTFSHRPSDRRAVDVCLRISPDFGLTVEEAKELFEEATATWHRYLNAQDIHLKKDGKKFRPATRLDWVDCSKSPSLEILLGVSDARVNEHRRKFVNPIAYAWPTSPGGNSGWGKGYLWFSPRNSHAPNFPNWKSGTLADKSHFLQTAIHEWGHVVGCDHVAGTIMRPDILAYLQKDAGGDSFARRYADNQIRHNLLLGNIDGELQLMLSRICFGKEGDECLNDVETRLLNEGGDLWPDDLALRLIFGAQRPKTVKMSVELRTRSDGTQRIVLDYVGYATRTSPEQVKYSIELPNPPFSNRRDPQLFRMRLGTLTHSYRAAGDTVLDGNIVINGLKYTALVQRAPEVSALTRVWFVHENRRIRLN